MAVVCADLVGVRTTTCVRMYVTTCVRMFISTSMCMCKILCVCVCVCVCIVMHVFDSGIDPCSTHTQTQVMFVSFRELLPHLLYAHVTDIHTHTQVMLVPSVACCHTNYMHMSLTYIHTRTGYACVVPWVCFQEASFCVRTVY